MTVELNFDPDWVKQQLERQEWEPDPENDSNEVRSLYLGTVFGLTPSRKYYTPFACSNVALCEVCGGSGEIENEYADEWVWHKVVRASQTLRMMAVELHGAYCNGDWPDDVVAAFRGLDMVATQKADVLQCDSCGGLGSEEAYHDHLWWGLVEKLYDSHGFSVESGEGDPCDIFARMYREKDHVA